jgi:nucleotide-binding universal stress UspA family protein
VLDLRHDDVKEIVKKALEGTNEIFQAMSVPLDHLRLKRQTEAALEELDEEPEEAGVVPETESETLATLLRDVTAQMDRVSPDDLGAITMMVMEALYRGGPFDHVMFALLDDSGHRLVGKLGFGESIDKMIHNFNFPVIGASGPVAAAILKRTDVFVAGPRDRRYEGTRFVQVMAAPVFGIYPLAAAGSVIGCLYFDRQEPKPFDAAALAAIAALRDQLGRALTRSRTGNILATGQTGR